jgi:hypothetical protein
MNSSKENLHSITIRYIANRQLQFEVDKALNSIEYRCMLLPVTNDVLNNEVKKLEEIANNYDPKIAGAQASVISRQAALQSLSFITGKKKQTTLKQAKLQRSLKKQMRGLVKLHIEKKKAILKLQTNNDRGFVFNLPFMEQVAAGNYVSVGTKQNEAANEASSVITYTVELPKSVTDVFGNALAENEQYIPIVLSITKPERGGAGGWSGYSGSEAFTYAPPAENNQ